VKPRVRGPSVFAVPGEAYEVTLYRGEKAEKHTVKVSVE
jgi:hypothetical protein